MTDVTLILRKIETGDSQAADELLPLVYQELRKLAVAKMGRESAAQTLQPTALVHEALEKFAAEDPQKAELVKLRYFAGLTLEEAAAAMGIPEGTAKRWWTYTRTRLYRELRPG